MSSSKNKINNDFITTDNKIKNSYLMSSNIDYTWYIWVPIITILFGWLGFVIYCIIEQKYLFSPYKRTTVPPGCVRNIKTSS